MTALVLAFMAETGLVSWRSVNTNKRPPFPSELVAPVLAYGVLGAVASYRPAATGAALVGWGLVAATFLNLYQPVTPTASDPTGTNPAGTSLSAVTAGLE